jgi:hypothetical protein
MGFINAPLIRFSFLTASAFFLKAPWNETFLPFPATFAPFLDFNNPSALAKTKTLFQLSALCKVCHYLPRNTLKAMIDPAEAKIILLSAGAFGNRFEMKNAAPTIKAILINIKPFLILKRGYRRGQLVKRL